MSTDISNKFNFLPRNVTPSHYHLHIKPNLTSHIFHGLCKINIKINTSSNSIVLNALNLTFSKIIFYDELEKEHTPETIELSVQDETIKLVFKNNLPVGKGDLHMEYEGKINDKMKGFYKSKYFAQDGEERYTAVTQFQATDARRAFPCWDEPGLKSTFDIILTVPFDKLAISNMNIVSEKKVDTNSKEIKFATTPIMSTYLIAFVIGEYDFQEGKTSNGIPIRVYTPLGKKDQGNYALETSLKALKFYSDYFKIGYPLPKLDLITISDLALGAMENWGLITYREGRLLVDSNNSSVIVKHKVALTIAHEIAHMWFGNLVTMKWWTHLWLNESFANFIAYLCIDNLLPEYDIWSHFVSSYSNSMSLDALDNSHPIEVPVGHPSEIGEIFDLISYCKGASIIRMLHKYIGDELFRKGMGLYLSRHSYRNTETKDLCNALEEACDIPLGTMMSTWTKQKGFPLITIFSKHEVDTGKRILSLSQKKFRASSIGKDNYIWIIPVTFSTSKAPNEIAKQVLFDSERMEVVIEGLSANDWVKVNPGLIGFYRVSYSKEMLNNLLKNVYELPPIDRLGIQNDVFALAQAGYIPTHKILKYLLSFKKESDYLVWVSISDCIDKLGQLLSNTDFMPQFQLYCQILYCHVFEQLGWVPVEGENQTDTLLRNLVLTHLISARDAKVIAQGKKLFDDFVEGKNIIHADQRSAIYKAAMCVGPEEKTLQQMLKLYKETEHSEEKCRIKLAMQFCTNEIIIRRVLDFSLSESVKSQDTIFLIISVSRSKKGRELALNFLKENIVLLRDRYKNNYLGGLLVKSILENFAIEEKAQEIEKFFDENLFPGTERSINQALETIRYNVKWLSRDEGGLCSYLNSNIYTQ